MILILFNTHESQQQNSAQYSHCVCTQTILTILLLPSITHLLISTRLSSSFRFYSLEPTPPDSSSSNRVLFSQLPQQPFSLPYLSTLGFAVTLFSHYTYSCQQVLRLSHSPLSHTQPTSSSLEPLSLKSFFRSCFEAISQAHLTPLNLCSLPITSKSAVSTPTTPSCRYPLCFFSLTRSPRSPLIFPHASHHSPPTPFFLVTEIQHERHQSCHSPSRVYIYIYIYI